ncbi:MAG TPA: PAS domain S-box protein [Candidatus Manganitrophaceae bacterium]|nr:PAS domain S-box protein [Candidatus Manganitrophaceae bacterium]
MEKPLQVLIVEDSEDDTRLIVEALKERGYDPIYQRVETSEEMITALRQKQWDLILSDYFMPRFDAIKAMQVARESGLDIPFIIISGSIGEEIAVAAMKTGAHDYMMKDNLSRLSPAIEREMQESVRRREHRQAEAALRESEERFRDVFDRAPIGITLIAPDGRWLRVNRVFCRMLGYSEQELSAITFQSVIHPDDFEINSQDSSPLLAMEGDSFVEKRFFHKDGHLIWANVSATVIRSVEGTAPYLLVQVQDITERKRSEERIRFQASLLDQVRSAVITIDLEQKVLFWNKFAETLCQWKKEEALGRNVLELIVPDENREAAEEILASLKKSGQWEGEFVIRRKDGSSFPAYFHNASITGKNGEVIGFVGVMTDITERKQAEKELEDYNQRLQHLSRRLLEAQENERRRIAGELHDEIGQSLTAVKIRLQSAQRHPDLVLAKLEECVQIADQAMKEVRNLSLNLHPPQLDELGLIAALRWHLDRQGQAANLILHFSAHPLPARLRPDLEIACFRIAQEALTNVIRYAQAHRVSVKLRQRGNHLHLIIKDDGQGFDPKIAQDRAMRGTSLGMVGMQERAQLAGGRVEWRSSPGRGTQVDAVFPLIYTTAKTASEEAGS